ncbi:MAG: S1/P1 Nuclease [Flavobacteriales bacterium]|nr:S1/P1 Nuclease [Flavobacteriales bacterium]MBP9081047.1 S1/P1 Nuclease [Flavobacteriales bacterium]
MRRLLILRTACLVAAFAVLWPFLLLGDAQAWGFYGHRRINRMAVFTLPPAMFGFYKRHIDYVTDHATDPDSRRYAVQGEAPRHFIDIDHYVEPGMDPFQAVPQDWDLAVQKFTEDTLQAYGIVPWYIPVEYRRLVSAFKRGDVDRILYYSAEIGHYIADAHVPLHTTENYNGQLTGQHGIHAFWESRIPETSAEQYDHFTGRARYINDPRQAAWSYVVASHAALDTVFGMERELQQRFPEHAKYTFEQRGRNTVQMQSKEFIQAYESAMGGMVERRMNASIIAVGSFWYSAWVDAGQPDLDRLEQKEVSDSLKQVLKAEEEQWKASQKQLGRPEPNE